MEGITKARTMKKANISKETPLEDLWQDALNDYDKGASAINSYNSEIPKAINYYFSHKIGEQKAVCNWYIPFVGMLIMLIVSFLIAYFFI